MRRRRWLCQKKIREKEFSAILKLYDNDEKNEDKNGELRSINKSRCNTFDNYQNPKDAKSICWIAIVLLALLMTQKEYQIHFNISFISISLDAHFLG